MRRETTFLLVPHICANEREHENMGIIPELRAKYFKRFAMYSSGSSTVSSQHLKSYNQLQFIHANLLLFGYPFTL